MQMGEDTQEKQHMTMEGETSVMYLQAKAWQGLPEARERQEGFPPRAFRRSLALPTNGFQTPSL